METEEVTLPTGYVGAVARPGALEQLITQHHIGQLEGRQGRLGRLARMQ